MIWVPRDVAPVVVEEVQKAQEAETTRDGHTETVLVNTVVAAPVDTVTAPVNIVVAAPVAAVITAPVAKPVEVGKKLTKNLKKNVCEGQNSKQIQNVGGNKSAGNSSAQKGTVINQKITHKQAQNSKDKFQGLTEEVVVKSPSVVVDGNQVTVFLQPNG